MEVLQNAVGSCQPLSPFPACSPLPSTRASSFTPISTSSAPLCQKTNPLHTRTLINSLKVPTKLEANAAAGADDASLAENYRTRTLILMRSNAAAGYAAALAEIGQSKRILDLIHADLKKLAAFLQHKQLHGFLLNPSIQDAHKRKILARLAEEAAFLPYTLKVVNLMVEKKRAALLKDMVKEFEVIYRKITSTEVALILAATELDPEQLASIAKYIPNVPAGSILDAVDPSFHLMGYIINYGKDTDTVTAVNMVRDRPTGARSTC